MAAPVDPDAGDEHRWRCWHLAGRPVMVRNQDTLVTYRAPWADLAPVGWPGRDPGDRISQTDAVELVNLFNVTQLDDRVLADQDFSFSGLVSPIVGTLSPGRMVVASGRAGLVEIAGALVSASQLSDPGLAGRVLARLLSARLKRFPAGSFHAVTVAAWADQSGQHVVGFDPDRLFGAVRRTIRLNRPISPTSPEDVFRYPGMVLETAVCADAQPRMVRAMFTSLLGTEPAEMASWFGRDRCTVVMIDPAGQLVPVGSVASTEPDPVAAVLDTVDCVASHVRFDDPPVALAVLVSGDVPSWMVVTVDGSAAVLWPGRFVADVTSDVDLLLASEALNRFRTGQRVNL